MEREREREKEKERERWRERSCGQELLLWFLWEGQGKAGEQAEDCLVSVCPVGSGVHGCPYLPGTCGTGQGMV